MWCLVAINAAFLALCRVCFAKYLLQFQVKEEKDSMNQQKIGMLICGVIVTSRYGHRIKAFKQRIVGKQ